MDRHPEEGITYLAIAELTAEHAERNNLFPLIYGLIILPSAGKEIGSNVVEIDELLPCKKCANIDICFFQIISRLLRTPLWSERNSKQIPSRLNEEFGREICPQICYAAHHQNRGIQL